MFSKLQHEKHSLKNLSVIFFFFFRSAQMTNLANGQAQRMDVLPLTANT